MKWVEGIRRALRIILCLVFCLMMYLVGAIIKLFTLKNHPARFKITCRATSFWGHGMALIFGMKIKVSGPVPAAPFFLVSNHVSYTDVLLVCAVCPAWFISKSEVASWPGIGALTRIGPTIYIDRGMRKDVKRMNQLIGSLVKNGEAVGFFPEGTTTSGEDVLPFKPSLFQPAVEMNLPVTTAAISYKTRAGMSPAEKIVAWYGDMEFAPHASHLLGQPGFTAHIQFGSETITADNRKDLAKQSHAQVAELLYKLKNISG